MKPPLGPVLWFFSGALIAYALPALIGFGAFVLLPSIAFAGALIIFRARGWEWGLIGGGACISVLWTLHITSGDTPDNQVWPIAVGVISFAFGLWLLRRPTTQ